MSNEEQTKAMIAQQARQWLERVHAPEVCDADIEALTEWLNLSEAHLDAFDAAELEWADAQVAAAGATVLPFAQRVTQRVRRPQRPPIWAWAMAASVAVAAISTYLATRPPAPVLYQTAKGDRQDIVLSDGTKLSLNTDTRLTVQMLKDARRVQLQHGEMAVRVVHNAQRPFYVEMGSQTLVDLGTEFNVSRLDDQISVAVREGEVGFAATRQPSKILTTVRPGEQAVQDAGATSVRVTPADPDMALAWRQGRVIYRDQSLAFVVKDLNRYMKTPLVTDSTTGQLRVTAVIVLDSEASVVKRLEAFLPLQATTTADAVYLRRRP